MKFLYFKRPDGSVVRRQQSIALNNKDSYELKGWIQCDENGKVKQKPKKTKKEKSEE